MLRNQNKMTEHPCLLRLLMLFGNGRKKDILKFLVANSSFNVILTEYALAVASTIPRCSSGGWLALQPGEADECPLNGSSASRFVA